jgi:hypothetical protein
MAAKAAGIEWCAYYPDKVSHCDLCLQPSGRLWNPLTGDGDALRLAVKLRINLHVCESDAMTTAYAEGAIQGASVDFMDDPYAATRRAIVRAAAEIGKAMP